jgi:hypothetical protein
MQISSLLHFHHTHSEGESQLIVSVHPVDQHTSNHNDHHSNDHQHSERDHYDVDLTFIWQLTPKTITDFPTRLYSKASVVTLNKPAPSHIIQKVHPFILQQKVYSSSISSRSPPYLS